MFYPKIVALINDEFNKYRTILHLHYVNMLIIIICVVIIVMQVTHFPLSKQISIRVQRAINSLTIDSRYCAANRLSYTYVDQRFVFLSIISCFQWYTFQLYPCFSFDLPMQSGSYCYVNSLWFSNQWTRI